MPYRFLPIIESLLADQRNITVSKCHAQSSQFSDVCHIYNGTRFSIVCIDRYPTELQKGLVAFTRYVARKNSDVLPIVLESCEQNLIFIVVGDKYTGSRLRSRDRTAPMRETYKASHSLCHCEEKSFVFWSVCCYFMVRFPKSKFGFHESRFAHAVVPARDGKLLCIILASIMLMSIAMYPFIYEKVSVKTAMLCIFCHSPIKKCMFKNGNNGYIFNTSLCRMGVTVWLWRCVETKKAIHEITSWAYPHAVCWLPGCFIFFGWIVK